MSHESNGHGEAHSGYIDRDGYYIPDTHLPDPTIWPFVLAIGITLFAAGVALGLVVILLGLIIVAIGVGGWIYDDIQLERRKEQH